MTVISYPGDAVGDYDSLEAYIGPLLPQDESFAILGESFSGPLALRIAARGHGNLAAVILVASFVTRPVAWMPASARQLLRPFVFRLPLRRPLLRWLLMGANAPAELEDRTMESLEAVEPVILARRVSAALCVDATEAFIRCPVPIFYLGGSQDRLISPQIVRRLKALRPDLECPTLDAPHFVLQHEPVSAANAISKFLSRC